MLNKILEAAKALANWVLEKHPEFKQFVEEGKYKELQQKLEVDFSKQEKVFWVERNLLNEEQCNAVKQHCELHGINFTIAMKAIAKLALHRRVSITVFANMLKQYFKSPDELFEFIDKLVEAQLVIQKENLIITQTCFTLSKEQEDELELFQSNPCMVYKPNKVYKTKSGHVRNGYLNLKRGVFSRKAEGTDEVPFDFLNIQNSIKYRVNYVVWDGYIKYHPELPERNEDDDDASYQKKVIEAYRHHFKKCFILEMFKQLNIEDIYILNMFDYRGRNYPISYLFNPQGQDSDKALLSFEPKPINKLGIQWLAISIANNFNCKYQGKSLDKNKYVDRLKWYEEEIKPNLNLQENEFLEWLTDKAEQAESPACFWSQVHNMYEIQKQLQKGETPMCWCITHFDATASGYQLQAIFAKDRMMAMLTNLINNPDKERIDLYTVLYEALIARGLPSRYTRNQVKKKCFVPAVYNSSRSIKELFTNEEEVKIFYEVMNQFSMWRMNRLFPNLWNNQALEYAWYMPDGFKVYRKIYQKRQINITYNDTEVPLYFDVNAPQEYSLELGPNITHACDGLVARELARRLNWNPKWKKWLGELYINEDLWTKQEDKKGSRKLMEDLLTLAKEYNFYSMRILTEVTPSNIDLIPKEVFERLYSELPEESCYVSEIHDSFGVHPNHVSALVGQYKMILRDIAKSNYLSIVVAQFTGSFDKRFVFDKDEELANEIMKSIYPLC